MDNNNINFHNIMDSIEDDCKAKKVKESVLLLKRKMCKTHDLIKQYSENVKEIDHLRLNLEIAKKEGIQTICNYKSAMDKIKELQLKISEDKQINEKLINQINEYEINIAADKQTMQQLICKIKDLEDKCSTKDMEYNIQKSAFEDRINDLEHELKKSKGISKKKEKKIISTDSDTTKLSIGTKSSSDIGINVSLCDINVSLCDKEISVICETQDKSIITDEFYNMKDDPHPLFCAKCEVHLSPDITPELICRSMSVYPKLIEKNLSPLKKISSPPCLISSSYLDSTNRNVNVPSRKIVPHMNPYSQDNDSVMSNLNTQSGRSSAMTQICENVELKNADISRIPVATNNLDSISTALAWSQNRNAVEDFCSDNLLAKHSSSIKEMERKIRLLDNKVKKFRRLKKKLDNNSCCRRSMNDDILLNSNLLTVICKSVAEYYDEKREACSKKRDIDSEKCTCSMKKAKLKRRQQLNKSNVCKNTCSICKVENCDKKCQVRDMFCNKNAKKTDILQCEHKLSVYNNSFSDINTSSTSFNDIDESDQREVVLHENNILHSTVTSVEDNLISYSADEMYANLLDKDNEETMDVDNRTETESIVLFNDENDENSTNHVDDIVADNKTERNEIESKAQDISKDKVGEIYAHDNLLNEDHVKAIDVDDQPETETTVLSNNKNSTNHIKSKIVDNNAERNEIKSKAQDISKDKVGEIYARDNLLNEAHIKAIDIVNQTETETTVLSNNENSTNHIKGKIDNNAEKNEIKNKAEGIHKDKVDKTYARGNLLNEDNTEDTDIDCQTKTETIFSNGENFTSHVDDKIVDIKAKENMTQSKIQNIHKDNIGEIHVSDLLNKGNVKTVNMNKRAETTVLSDYENSTDHTDDKIVDINAEENEIKSKGQTISEGRAGETYANDNLLSKNNNVQTIDINNQTETRTAVLSNDENSTDHTDGKIDNNAEKNDIKSKAQNIHKDKVGEIYASDNLLNKDNVLSKGNIETVDMDKQTKTKQTVLPDNEDSTIHTKIKIDIKCNPIESKIKRKGQSSPKGNVGDRILKKLRKLKRKTPVKSCISKQENVESRSGYNSDQSPKKSRIENREESGDHSLTSVISLKRKLDTGVESINKQEDKLSDNDYKPAKKLRIAHSPKPSISQLGINKTNMTHNTIRNLATLMTRRSSRNEQLNRQKGDLLTESKQSRTINKKCNEKNVKSNETNSTDKRSTNKKDLASTNAKDCLQSNDISSPVVSEFEKCNDVLTENTEDRSISMNRVTGKTSTNSDELNVLHNNTANDTVNDLELKKLSIPLRKCTITQLKANKVFCNKSKYNKLTVPLKTTETSKEISPTVGLQLDSYKAFGNENQDDHKITKDTISNSKSSILHDQSKVSEATRNESHNNDVFDRITEIRSPSPDSGTIVEDYTNDSNMKESHNKIQDDIRKETCINNKTNEIQAETQKGNVSQQSKKMKCINEVEVSHEIEHFEMPITKQLDKYIQRKPIKKYKKPRKQITDVIKTTDIFVKSQLKRLIDSAWTTTVHDDIVEKLGYTCGPRIIAKCIIEFLSEEVDHAETLDKSFTPPAPLMKIFEQKIITLLIDLEVLKPTVICFVQAAIEYTLFRLNKSDVKIYMRLVDSLTRIYVVLSRIQKDREKVRMMCCNALYCMSRQTISVLYTVLTCWPEVLPNAEANKELLPKCIAFLVSSEDFNQTDKLQTLRNYLLRYYKYNFVEETESDIVKELMTALKAERIDGLDTAIILIAKRKGPDWTYENIIQSALLPMIINNEHPCVYSAFSLLGRLLRAFPLKNLEKDLEENSNIVKNISEQLRDLIKSGEGSHDRQEGIISAMLSLSRHEFNIIAPSVIKWTPSKSLRPVSNRQIEAFINSRNAKFWKNYLEKL